MGLLELRVSFDPTMIETKLIDRYRNIRPGDIVTLCDEQTIKQLMDDGVSGAMDGVDLEVTTVRRVACEGIAEYYFCDLDSQSESSPPLILVIKIVENHMDRRVYWPPDDVPQGSRGDLVDGGCEWLFQEPTDVNDFRPADLQFTKRVFQHVEKHGEVCYDRKGEEIHGVYREVSPGGGQPQPATVVEWLARTEVDNPELLALEVGGLNEHGERIAEGGLVTFLQGATVSGTDINLLSS